MAIDVPASPLYWFRGYYQDPERTAERFRYGGRYYLTADAASIDEQGILHFASRADDVITSAGYRIGPFEVESALIAHDAVAEVAVIGTPDELRGEAVTAFVVVAPGVEPDEELAAALQLFVKSRLAKHLYPRHIVFTKELPRTPSGKIRRTVLTEDWRDRDAERASAVSLSREGDLLRAVLNRPQSHNAIDREVIEGLERMLAEAESGEAKVLMIRGEGGSFCSGADLAEVKRLLERPEGLREFMARLRAVFDRLEAAPWVSLAVVEGFALAGGCELLLACDVVLAAESAQIGDRHAEYALAPAAGGSVRMLEALPRARARHLLLSGEMLSGREAAAAGLVSLAVPDERLDAEAERIAERLRSRGRGSIATIKLMIGPETDAHRRSQLDRELELFIEHAGSEEFRAGLDAFGQGKPGSFA